MEKKILHKLHLNHKCFLSVCWQMFWLLIRIINLETKHSPGRNIHFLHYTIVNFTHWTFKDKFTTLHFLHSRAPRWSIKELQPGALCIRSIFQLKCPHKTLFSYSGVIWLEEKKGQQNKVEKQTWKYREKCARLHVWQITRCVICNNLMAEKTLGSLSH